MHRMLPLSLILATLMALAPANLSAKPSVSLAVDIAGVFAFFAIILSGVTLGFGIAASNEPAACDLNSEYNITVNGTGCVGLNCTPSKVLCENVEGEQIDGLKTNNPHYRTFIWVTAGVGVAAAITVTLSIASCVAARVLGSLND